MSTHDIYASDPELFNRIAALTDEEDYAFEQAARAEEIAERRWEER